jgi:hypothetical protein
VASSGSEPVVARRAVGTVTASRRVPEKAGLRHVRTSHQPGPYTPEGDGWERDG